MSTKNTFKWIADLYKRNRAIFHIVLFIIIGLVFIYWIDYALAFETLYSWNLSYINNLTGTFGFILSVITIYLLYINYQQQRKELHSLIEQNNDIIEENRSANELQVVLSEKQIISMIINDLKSKDQDAFTRLTNHILALIELLDGLDVEHVTINGQLGSVQSSIRQYIVPTISQINNQIRTIKQIIKVDNDKIFILNGCFSVEFNRLIHQLYSIELYDDNTIFNVQLDWLDRYKRVFEFLRQ